MADTKLADLTALTTTSDDDILYVVDDPAGTPADRKLALSDVFKRGTVTTSSPVIDAAQTWNDGGVTFTGLKFNATDTASAAGSLLMDLQVGGSSKVKIAKNGRVSLTGTTNFSGFDISTSGFTLYLEAASTQQFFVASNQFGSVGANSYISFNGLVGDTFIGRRAAANLRLGAADAAAPVAQTLSVQSVVAGQTNVAGANLTITGSQGTGTGAGGSIIFQVAPAGSSGTAQNALADALTINADRQAIFHAGTEAKPGIALSESNSGFYLQFANAINLSLGGVAYFLFRSTGVTMREGMSLSWLTNGPQLSRDAANTLAVINGVNAQEQRLYASYTSATNFQRMSIKTLRESSGALSGASYTTTIAIPAYANLIGVTTRVTTAVTGATTYDVGDGSDADLWGAAIGIALGSQSRTADFTAVGAVGAAATSRTVTLTANGSNFTGGVVEICLHYITTEAD